ncbi:MAG TPA: response regulator [Coleofasciculaceae cyanobacterium]
MNGTTVDAPQDYILIVDDQPDNLRLLSKTLTDAGYKVKSAISAQMALIGISSGLPEVILLDIMMPDMDGYHLCQHLKANPQTHDIPVIFLSALDHELDKIKAFEVGGCDYITKPFQVREVLARVNNQLTLVRQQRKIIEQNAQLVQQNLCLEQLNAELMHSNQELVRSNKDLEEFAFIASHDLRSPLQSLKAFTYLLTQKYQDVLDEKATRYITRIAEAGDRMERLIQDLLNYSRVGTSSIELEPTDCNQILELVLADLQEVIDSTGAVINYKNLPTVAGNTTQLTQLFQNLIGNALKFRHPDVVPQITISVKPKNFVEKELSNVKTQLSNIEANNSSSVPLASHQTSPGQQSQESQGVNEWLFGIQDNGIGIEPDYFERIFQVFQRLHSIEEYPGTGIGLAICKKIVERHGGCIWVESSFGVGTTFFFTLLAPQDASALSNSDCDFFIPD